LRTLLILVLVFAPSWAVAQAIQITGGDSTLYRAQGGEIRAMFATSETDVSAGVLNGHVYSGVIEKMSLGRWNLAAGDVRMPFDLMTDFNQSHLQFPATGLIATRKTDQDKLTFFAGATSENFELPFFFGTQLETPTAGMFYERALSDGWKFTSSEVVSTAKQTAIQELSFKPSQPTTFSLGAGVGNNSPFAAVRAAYETRKLTGVVSYTERGASFERIVIPYYTISENDGLDARVNWAGEHFNIFGDRENLLSDLNNEVIRSTINSVGGGGSVSIVSGSCAGFYGESNGKIVRGETAGAGVTVGSVTGRFDYYVSTGGASTSLTFSEKVSRHFSVNQFIENMHSVNAGGSWTSNSFTASGGYAMTFLPAVGGFDKVLSVTLSVQLPRGLRIDGGTVTTPDGHTRWTAMGNTYQQGPLSGVSLGGSNEHATGKYTYAVKFATAAGDPVDGAVMVGKTEIYAVHGLATLPSRKLKPQSLAVKPEDFMTPGRWRVVSAPATATPEQSVTVIVERL
jgi:hypothetical protein